jgi:hypothetical protein
MKRCSCVLLVLILSLSASSQTKWYKFSKEFINSHYPQDSAIGALKAATVAPAKTVHRVTCGGNDGEIHIGIEGTDVQDAGSSPISAVADQDTSDFGWVAEPVNLTTATKQAVAALDGQAATFSRVLQVVE